MTAGDERTRRIQAALDDFYATLDGLPVVGVARWADLGRLDDLLRRHPEAARRLLGQAEAGPADVSDPPAV